MQGCVDGAGLPWRVSVPDESRASLPVLAFSAGVDADDSPRRRAATRGGSHQPGRFATKSISTSASRASAVTPTQVLAGSASAGK